MNELIQQLKQCISVLVVDTSIYHDLSIYLPPCCRERRHFLIKKIVHFVRTKPFSDWANDHILGRRS